MVLAAEVCVALKVRLKPPQKRFLRRKTSAEINCRKKDFSGCIEKTTSKVQPIAVHGNKPPLKGCLSTKKRKINSKINISNSSATAANIVTYTGGLILLEKKKKKNGNFFSTKKKKNR